MPSPHKALAAASLVAALAVPSTALAAPSPGCSLAATPLTATATPQGDQYLIHVPAGVSNPAPVVVSLHGLLSSASAHAGHTEWAAWFDSRPFAVQKAITVFPEGGRDGWTFTANSAEIALIDRVLHDVWVDRCVNTARVYATGHSSGGYMAQRLACSRTGTYAAVAEYEGGSVGSCTGRRPIHLFDAQNQTSAAAADDWRARFGCSAFATTLSAPDVIERVAVGCSGSPAPRYTTYPTQNHAWPDNDVYADGVPRNDHIRSSMWRHFAANPHPSPPASL